MSMKIDELKAEDLVVCELTEDMAVRHKLAMDHAANSKELSRRAVEELGVSMATMTLLWSDVKKLSERAETAKSRGLELVMKLRQDGKIVVVEQKHQPCDCLICQLKRAGGA